MVEKTIKYLKPETYYRDLYDRITVEKFRSDMKYNEEYRKHGKLPDCITKEEVDTWKEYIIDFKLFFDKGGAYAEKEKTITGWMSRDRAKDDLLDTAEAPENIQCLTCRSYLSPISKDLYDWEQDKKDRVIFMYECPNGCLPRRAFFADGEEYRKKPNLCPKCKNEIKRTYKADGDKTIIVYTCATCGYNYKDVSGPSPKMEFDIDFVKDKERFCLSDEDGRRFVNEVVLQADNIKSLLKLVEKNDSKPENELKKLRKINIAELNNLLSPILEKEGYLKLDFSKPDIGRDVIINFSAQDNKTDRQEYDSKTQLRRIMNKAVDDTNWRLMSEGIDCRLGILSGKLRGYEKEEDLTRLTRQQSK